MDLDTFAPVLVIGIFVLWIYCIYRMFTANRHGGKKPGYTVVDSDTGESQDELVVIARFSDQLTADLHRVHLESEGIEGKVTGNPYSKRCAGYSLRVRSEDAPRAIDILNRELREMGE